MAPARPSRCTCASAAAARRPASSSATSPATARWRRCSTRCRGSSTSPTRPGRRPCCCASCCGAARAIDASRPGTDSALARIAELVFIDALRRHAELLPPAGKGWLAALRDPRIGRALALLHAEPAQAWTLDELANRVALSRSALADRFAALVGEPPMQYLMRWRLAIAARALRSGAEAIVRIAERAGYESDAAFSRAFKREFGMPPAAWRRRAALAA